MGRMPMKLRMVAKEMANVLEELANRPLRRAEGVGFFPRRWRSMMQVNGGIGCDGRTGSRRSAMFGEGGSRRGG